MTWVHWAWEMTGVYGRKAQVAEHTGCQGWANVTAGLKMKQDVARKPDRLQELGKAREWNNRPPPRQQFQDLCSSSQNFVEFLLPILGIQLFFCFSRMWAFSSSNVLLLFCHNSSSFNILSLTHFLAPSGILPTLQCSGEDSTVAWGPQSSACQSSKVCRSTTGLWQIPPALAALVDEFIFPFSDRVVRREKQQPKTLKIQTYYL